MRGLIQADLRRVLRRPTVYIFTVVLLFLVLVRGLGDDTFSQIAREEGTVNYLVVIVASIPIYLGYFGEDFRSGTIIGLIGRGMSRKKVLLAKLFTSAVILAGIYLIVFGELVLIRLLSRYPFSSTQYLNLALLILIVWIRNIGYIAFGSLIMYLFWSVPAGMITSLLLAAFLKLILTTAQMKIRLDLFSVTFDGLMEKGYQAIVGKNIPFAFIGAAVWFALSLILGFVVFNRKELDL